tara:strand:+ start:2553 stop:2879 length:327 start_codon:yes stop_codon:yes gene_type:complete
MPSYYLKRDYKLLGFRKSNVKGKQYYALLEQKQNKKLVRVNFGSMMENYRDITGLNAYPHLIHGDKTRRKAYRSRHIGYLKDGYYSPSYFSYYYLWIMFYIVSVMVLY